MNDDEGSLRSFSSTDKADRRLHESELLQLLTSVGVGLTLSQADTLLRAIPRAEDNHFSWREVLQWIFAKEGRAVDSSQRDDLNTCPRASDNSRKDKRQQSVWWQLQSKRPLRLIFIRHGESEANVDRKITQAIPDQSLHLTALGRSQAIDAGERLRSLIGDASVKFSVSPYTRTRETLNGILHAWGPDGKKLKVHADVRLREQEYGNFDSPDISHLHHEKKEFGAFYYRFPDGESPADCFDRASLFWESVYRSWEDNEHENHVIVGHGMMILVTLMRLLRLQIDEFENLDSLTNCEFVVLERPVDDPKFVISFTWAGGAEKAYGGLRVKEKQVVQQDIWDGTPDAPMLKSSVAIKDRKSFRRSVFVTGESHDSD